LKSRGIALLAGMVLLAAVSILALTASSGMILQRHMTTNFQEDALALESATVADAYAKAWIYSRPVNQRERGCSNDCVLPPGFVSADTLPQYPELESTAWWHANSHRAGFNPDTGETYEIDFAGSDPARWIIGELHYTATGDKRGENAAEGLAYYRVISRGSGRHRNSIAVTESIVVRPWEGDFEAGTYPPQNSSRLFCSQFEAKYECGNLSWRRRR
jgi:Tfp pilus assembly protein PilX